MKYITSWSQGTIMEMVILLFDRDPLTINSIEETFFQDFLVLMARCVHIFSVLLNSISSRFSSNLCVNTAVKYKAKYKQML